MKFANLKFNARGINNIGDNLQLIAIDNIYKEMGIDLNDIIYIDFHEISKYNGEYVILPLTMPMEDYIENGIAERFSSHIIPVFLGLNMARDYLYPKEIEYLRMFEPIGCRDNICLDLMRKYNIKSYLNGCITVTLPERSVIKEFDKVYIVDADQELVDLLPKSLFKNKKIIYKTHNYKNLIKDPKTTALEQYEEYKNEAALVITSLLHCALPCYTAGIPIIMINRYVSYRKAFLERLFTIWTPESLQKANNIKPDMLCDQNRILKDKILSLVKQRLIKVYDDNNLMYDISYAYESRNKNIYINDSILVFIQWLEKKWINKDGEYLYSIWGLTQASEALYSYITKNFTNAHLVNVYDSYKKVSFMGLNSKSPETIKGIEQKMVIFVTANGASPAAKTMEHQIRKENITFVYRVVIK